MSQPEFMIQLLLSKPGFQRTDPTLNWNYMNMMYTGWNETTLQALKSEAEES